MNPEIFKAYDIRGVYPDELNEEDAWKIGHATARFLPSLIKGYERGRAESTSLCVGRDMRTHSEPLAKALIEGIRSAGVGVIDLGMIDTPQMYFAINFLGTSGGVQVTASHNPAKYNGLKISGKGAIPIGVDTGLKEIKHLATALLHTKGNPTGPLEPRELWPEYKKHVLQFLRPNFRKRKVAIDASNGMAGKAVPLLFGDRPAGDRPDQLRAHGQVQARSRSAERQQSRPGQGDGEKGGLRRLASASTATPTG